jgi:hypothetical protein
MMRLMVFISEAFDGLWLKCVFCKPSLRNSVPRATVMLVSLMSEPLGDLVSY